MCSHRRSGRPVGLPQSGCSSAKHPWNFRILLLETQAPPLRSLSKEAEHAALYCAWASACIVCPNLPFNVECKRVRTERETEREVAKTPPGLAGARARAEGGGLPFPLCPGRERERGSHLAQVLHLCLEACSSLHRGETEVDLGLALEKSLSVSLQRCLSQHIRRHTA